VNYRREKHDHQIHFAALRASRPFGTQEWSRSPDRETFPRRRAGNFGGTRRSWNHTRTPRKFVRPLLMRSVVGPVTPFPLWNCPSDGSQTWQWSSRLRCRRTRRT
jgi:hypothetical protein